MSSNVLDIVKGVPLLWAKVQVGAAAVWAWHQQYPQVSSFIAGILAGFVLRHFI